MSENQEKVFVEPIDVFKTSLSLISSAFSGLVADLERNAIKSAELKIHENSTFNQDGDDLAVAVAVADKALGEARDKKKAFLKGKDETKLNKNQQEALDKHDATIKSCDETLKAKRKDFRDAGLGYKSLCIFAINEHLKGLKSNKVVFQTEKQAKEGNLSTDYENPFQVISARTRKS